MNKTTLTFSISLIFSLTPCQAEVITDGSAGPALNLPGPDFAIKQELGTLSGNNLFHSFSQFNLTQGQIATFTGDNSAIQNVISRVTGGGVSNIDGLLKSDIGQAAVYFINPAGIVFGQNAKVDVPGAFYASTANELQFADGGKFGANPLSGSSLSMAAPAAFGFLGAQTGTLALNGANLEFKSGATVQLNASNITLAGTDKDHLATIKGDGLNLQLVAVGNAAESVNVNALPDHALKGNITLTNAELSASGNGGGQISARAGSVNLVNSNISTNNTGNTDAKITQGVDMLANNIQVGDKSNIYSQTDAQGNAGNVTVRAGEIVIQGSYINSITSSNGDSGQVNISAGNMRLDGTSVIATLGTASQGNANDVTVNAGTITIDKNSQISSTTFEKSSGNAGGVTVNIADELAMHNGGNIHSGTGGIGNANQVDITAGKITMDSGASISTWRGGSDGNAGANVKAGPIFVKAGAMYMDGSYISASAFSPTNNKIAAGDVSVSVKNDLAVVNKGFISSDTAGEGNAGNVIIDANNIHLEGGGDISSSTLGQGYAGKVSITAHNDLVLLNESRIQAIAVTSSGNAGSVDVNAGSIRIDDSLITSSVAATSTGNAGNVKVNAQNELALTNFGQIHSSTFSQGNAGTVEVNAKIIHIDGHKPAESSSVIASTAEQGATGSVGSVSVTATEALFMNQGDISIRSAAVSNHSESLHPNQLVVTAPLIELTDSSRITAASTGKVPASAIQINTNQLTVAGNSQITTTANQGNGGPISINANDWLFLDNSQIATSVTGVNNGNGGDITLNGDILIMDSGFIQANTSAPKANGGNINLNIKQLVYSQDNLQRGGNTPLVFSPNSGQNVIQAASATGVNGKINITAPQLNVVGALASINAPELDLSRVGQEPCSSAARQSTLKSLGKGGVPLFNKGVDGYTIEHLLDAEPHEATNAKDATHATHASADCKPKPADKPLQQALSD